MKIDTYLNNLASMPFLHFIVLCLLVYRLTRMIVIDQLFSTLRDAVWARYSPGDSYIGYFFTCPWCVSMWISLPVTVLYIIFPSITFLVGCIFSLSAIAGLITARLDQ